MLSLNYGKKVNFKETRIFCAILCFQTIINVLYFAIFLFGAKYFSIEGCVIHLS